MLRLRSTSRARAIVASKHASLPARKRTRKNRHLRFRRRPLSGGPELGKSTGPQRGNPTTRSTGCDWWRRNTSLSSRSSAVRFLSLGVYCARHLPSRVRMRRKSNPRKPKLSPAVATAFEQRFTDILETEPETIAHHL